MSSFTTSRFPTLPLTQTKRRGRGEVSVDPVASLDIADEALMMRIQTGDCDALALLFRRYSQVIRGIGRKILRDEAEAEDLVQDIFLYLHRKCGVYNPTKGGASSWIIQTVYYQALQRRMKLTARHYYSSMEIEGNGEVALAASNAAQKDHFAEVVFGRSKWREILEALTEDQWETLRLHFFEGYTLGEIADKRGQTVGNIRHHFYRGLESLRKQVFPDQLSRRQKSQGNDLRMSPEAL
jgi:RNA polymerase sigma-70 factor, ECF subfamily